MEKDWPKRPSEHQIQEAGKKDNDRAITPVVEAVRVLVHSTSPGSLQAKQLCHLHAQLSLEQSCNRRKRCCVYTYRVASVVSYSLQPCRLWPARFLCQRGGFFRQEYWSVLANTGCHAVLEHYIFWCPSYQLPCVPGAARTPVTQATAPHPHLAFTGTDPSPPGQPQEPIPVDNPEVEIQPQLKPRGSVSEEEDPKHSHQLHKLQIKSTQSTKHSVSMEYIKGH